MVTTNEQHACIVLTIANAYRRCHAHLLSGWLCVSCWGLVPALVSLPTRYPAFACNLPRTAAPTRVWFVGGGSSNGTLLRRLLAGPFFCLSPPCARRHALRLQPRCRPSRRLPVTTSSAFTILGSLPLSAVRRLPYTFVCATALFFTMLSSPLRLPLWVSPPHAPPLRSAHFARHAFHGMVRMVHLLLPTTALCKPLPTPNSMDLGWFHVDVFMPWFCMPSSPPVCPFLPARYNGSCWFSPSFYTGLRCTMPYWTGYRYMRICAPRHAFNTALQLRTRLSSAAAPPAAKTQNTGFKRLPLFINDSVLFARLPLTTRALYAAAAGACARRRRTRALRVAAAANRLYARCGRTLNRGLAHLVAAHAPRAPLLDAMPPPCTFCASHHRSDDACVGWSGGRS